MYVKKMRKVQLLITFLTILLRVIKKIMSLISDYSCTEGPHITRILQLGKNHVTQSSHIASGNLSSGNCVSGAPLYFNLDAQPEI